METFLLFIILINNKKIPLMVAMITIGCFIDQTLPMYFGLGSGKVWDGNSHLLLSDKLEIIKAIVKHIPASICPSNRKPIINSLPHSDTG